MNLRQQIKDLGRQYFNQNFKVKAFNPGETFLPANGKVLDEHDLSMLLEASMDMWLTAGRFAEQFERKFSDFWGSRYSLLVNSGSSANLVAFSALTSPFLKDRALKPGDEFVTPAAGFPTTVNPAIQFGMTPVFIDIEKSIHNVTFEQVAAAITPKTKLVMIAHTLGNPFDAKRIAELCKEHNIWFIEDCCDALGAKIDGKAVGTFGDIATCSFYPAHHITMGEGGAVMTSSSVLKKLAESFRDWGRDCYCAPACENSCGKRYGWKLGDMPEGYDHKYIYSHIGYNLKATDMQAAVGISQLDKANEFIEKRCRNFKYLSEKLYSKGGEEYFEIPKSISGASPSWFGFLLTLKNPQHNRRAILEYLNEKKIGTRLLFGGNLTRQPAYKSIAYKVSGSLDQTDYVMNHSFYVGLWPGLGETELDYIVDNLLLSIRQFK